MDHQGQKHATSYWCPLMRKFKRGDAWVEYDSGMEDLERGFEVMWKGDIWVFEGHCWRQGNIEVSIPDFGLELVKADSEESVEKALLIANPARSSRTTQSAHS
ncbi:hypothetical protein QBC46DRAFT_414298 [Diplogelasinospora grovesii]|uniref:Uncharacterized protein n=1 Tax=Diplogelasinospora grovesii TaxID=303347 RepID=A0AAN6MV20_9PEZI|nr:hypothetical protein QBC46DRAFT_414298 [Diplogelasinospora grovesii]